MILGYPRSGSTVLGELINKEEGFIHVGELERLWYLRNNPVSILPQVTCSCKEKLFDCDFWSPHIAVLEKKILEISKRENLKLNNNILLEIRNQFIRHKKWEAKESKIYSEINSTLYFNLSKKEKKVIVDSSKELWYAEYLDHTGLFDITYIHLVRDLRGVVLSRQRKMKRNEDGKDKMRLNYKYLIFDSLRWNFVNWRIKKFLQNRKYLQIRYEEFLNDPENFLQLIGDRMDIKVNPSEILNEKKEFLIEENHVIHGNKFRFTRGKVKLLEDKRWKKELDFKNQYLLKFLNFFHFN
ncbi:sulfotransferase [Pontixanthobacter gangjinensis]